MIENPAKIMLMGDTHGDGMWVVKAIYHARRNKANVIVQLGDFGWWHPAGRKEFLNVVHRALEECDITLYWVAGNHECWTDIIESLQGSREAQPLDIHYPRIIHLPTGFRWTWWGERWMALGGGVSVDKECRVEGIDWWPQETLKRNDIEYAARDDGTQVDIIVAHDAPHGVSIPGIDDRNSPPAWPAHVLRESEDHRRLVREVVEAVRPYYMAHGHYHRAYRAYYQFGDDKRMVVQGLDMNGTTLERNTQLIERNSA